MEVAVVQIGRIPSDNFIVQPENFHKLGSWIYTHSP